MRSAVNSNAQLGRQAPTAAAAMRDARSRDIIPQSTTVGGFDFQTREWSQRKNGRPLKGPGLQRLQRAVGLIKAKADRVRFDGNGGRLTQQIEPVLSRIRRDTADHTLTKYVTIIVEGRNRRHV